MYIENANKRRWPKSARGLSQLAIVVPLFCRTLQDYSSGPPPWYSGVPGDNPDSCTSCHRGLSVNGGQGSVKILLTDGNSYMPGVTEHTSVQVSDPQHRWGLVIGQSGILNRPNVSQGPRDRPLD